MATRFRKRGRGSASVSVTVSGEDGRPTQITAAAQILHSQKIKRPGGKNQKKGSSQGWQSDTWSLFDEIGELWFAATWSANSLSRVRLIAAKLTDTDGEPDPVTEGPAAELVADFAGGAGGQAALLNRLGYHLSLVGDSYIVGRDMTDVDREGEPDPDKRIAPEGPPAPGDVEWQAYSTDEISYDSCWRVDDGVDPYDVTDSGVVIRCWRPHPRRWVEAQSPVRSTLPVLRQLRSLTMAIAAQLDSRLAGAGVLFLPQSMVFAPAEGDTGDGEDPFIRDLIEHMLTPLRDRDSAASIVPLVVKVADEAIGKIQHVTFSSPLDDRAVEQQENALKRFALSQDLPASVILGNEDSNHWTAWLEDEQAVRAHTAPMASAVALALTVGWLQPALEVLGVPDARDYVVWYDLTDLIHRPDKSAVALDLHDRFLIGDAAVLRETGFDPEDAPTPQELARMVLLTLIKSGGDVLPLLAQLGIRVDNLTPTGAEVQVEPAPASGQDDEDEPAAEEQRAIPQRTQTPPATPSEAT